MTAISLHGLLIAWIFVGILETSAGTYAWIRFFMELAPLAVLLLGGLWADRADARNLILLLSLLAIVLPLLLIPFAGSITLQVAFLFGLGMALLQALSDPARQSIINRVTRFDIQRTVTITTVITTLAGLVGVWVGGKLETIGIRQILVIQAAVIAASAFALGRLPALPPTIRAEESAALDHGLMSRLSQSFSLFWGFPLIRNVIGLNFLSSLFNAGAYTIGVPYIVTQVYEGNADFFADTMIWFMAGSIGSTAFLLLVMPLLHPGRTFICLQLTRVVILAALWLQPPVWFFFVIISLWGVNMGITTTLVRTVVQELAPEAHRAKILSIFLLSFMASAPLSSLMLGTLVEYTNPLAALLPGIPISIAIFFLGLYGTDLWAFRSPSSDTHDA